MYILGAREICYSHSISPPPESRRLEQRTASALPEDSSALARPYPWMLAHCSTAGSTTGAACGSQTCRIWRSAATLMHTSDSRNEHHTRAADGRCAEPCDQLASLGNHQRAGTQRRGRPRQNRALIRRLTSISRCASCESTTEGAQYDRGRLVPVTRVRERQNCQGKALGEAHHGELPIGVTSFP